MVRPIHIGAEIVQGDAGQVVNRKASRCWHLPPPGHRGMMQPKRTGQFKLAASPLNHQPDDVAFFHAEHCGLCPHFSSSNIAGIARTSMWAAGHNAVMNQPAKRQGRRPSKILPANSIAARLRALRLGRNLTQDELAAELGVARGTISKIENGDDPGGITSLHAMATFFGVPIDHLKTGSALPSNNFGGHAVQSELEISLFRLWAELNEIQKWSIVNMASVMVTGKPLGGPLSHNEEPGALAEKRPAS